MGHVTSPISLDDSRELIRSGRVFPTQLVSLNGVHPVPAFHHRELQEVCRSVSPPDHAFDGQSGRVSALKLGEQFARFAIERVTGRLFVRHSESGLQFAMRFVSGQLVEVSAFDPSTYLGQRFLQRQLLTPSQLVEAIEKASQEKIQLGKACIMLGFVTEKMLNQALAEQMFSRIRKIACFPHVQICFLEDPHAAMLPPLSRISGYSLLEITLGYGLPDHQIKEYVGDLLNRPVVIDRKATALRLISAEDRAVLKRVDATASLDPLTERSEWTQRDGALKAIAWDMMSIFSVPPSYHLTQEFVKLEGEQGLGHLGLSRLSTPDEMQQTIEAYSREHGLYAPSGSTDEEHIKQALRARLTELVKLAQGTDRERRVYQKMRQVGADPNDETVRINMLFDICIQEGEAALKRQKYDLAREAYQEATRLRPQDLSASLHEAWSTYLESDRQEADSDRANQRFRELCTRFPSSPQPMLFLARLQRLQGQLDLAENTLRKLLELSPGHVEAQAEQRLLFNREYDKKKMKVRALSQASPEVGVWLTALIITLALSGLFLGVGTLVPHPRTTWPESSTINTSSLNQLREEDRLREFSKIVRKSYETDLLITASYRLGLEPAKRVKVVKVGDEVDYDLEGIQSTVMREMTRSLSYLYKKFQTDSELVLSTLREARVIPAPLRFIGNVEHYWLSDDLFAWARRAMLMLIGIIALIRLRPLELKPTPAVGLSLAGLAYGGVVGYLSPAFSSPTPLGPLMGMKLAHCVSEVLFFQFYVGLALLRGFKWSPFLPTIGIILALMIFKMSMLNIWFMPLETMLLTSLQIGIFIGGIPLLFMWKSKSFTPPLVAHLALTIVPLIRGLS